MPSDNLGHGQPTGLALLQAARAGLVLVLVLAQVEETTGRRRRSVLGKATLMIAAPDQAGRLQAQQQPVVLVLVELVAEAQPLQLQLAVPALQQGEVPQPEPELALALRAVRSRSRRCETRPMQRCARRRRWRSCRC